MEIDQQLLREQFLNLLTPLNSNQEEVDKIVQHLKSKYSGKTGAQYRLVRMTQIALYLQTLEHSSNQKYNVCIQSVISQLNIGEAQIAINAIRNIIINSPKEQYHPSIMKKVQKLKIFYSYLNKITYLCHLIVNNMHLSMSHKQAIIKDMAGMICWYASRTGANIYEDQRQFLKIVYIVFAVTFEHSYNKTNQEIIQQFINVFGQQNQFQNWSQCNNQFHQRFLQLVKISKHHPKGISDLTFMNNESTCKIFSTMIITELSSISFASHTNGPEQWRVISTIRIVEDHQEHKHHQFKSHPIVHVNIKSTSFVQVKQEIINEKIDLQSDEYQ